MNADTLIEEIQKLPPEELQRVGTFLNGYLSDLEADKLSAGRAAELTSGAVQPLSHEQVFGHAPTG
jgi:hypothetical protein